MERGQKIFFRVTNEKTHHINKSKFVDIVSLRTETEEFFSLQDYNKYMKESLKHTRIAGLISALIFLVAFFVSIKGTVPLIDPVQKVNQS